MRLVQLGFILLAGGLCLAAFLTSDRLHADRSPEGAVHGGVLASAMSGSV